MGQGRHSRIPLIPVAIIILAIIAIWARYGSLNPCDMLKKEVAWQAAASSGGLAGYALFGGFVNNAIDTLTPLQCAEAVWKIKTGTKVNDVLNGIGSNPSPNTMGL